MLLLYAHTIKEALQKFDSWSLFSKSDHDNDMLDRVFQTFYWNAASSVSVSLSLILYPFIFKMVFGLFFLLIF